MDSPGEPGAAGGPGRVRGSARLPAWAGSWSTPVQLPGSCGSSVAVNRAGAVAAGGTFQAADGTTHVQVCTSPDGKTWQAADLGPGGDQPHGGPHPAVAVSPDGHVVALWGSTVGCPASCGYILQASVRPPGGGWGAPVTLSTEFNWGAGGLVLGMDGSGNAIAAWVGFYADASHYAVLPGGGWGPAQTLSTYVQGHARNLSLAVSPDGSAIVAYATEHDAIWAASAPSRAGSPPRSSWLPEITARTRPRRSRSMMLGRHRLSGRNRGAPRRRRGPPAGRGAPRRCWRPSRPARWPPRSTVPGTRSPCSGRRMPGTWPAAAAEQPPRCRRPGNRTRQHHHLTLKLPIPRTLGGWTTHPPSRPACAARTSSGNCPPFLHPVRGPSGIAGPKLGHRYRGDPAAVVRCPAIRTGNTRYGVSACKKWLSTGRTGPPSHSHGEHMPARRRHAEHIQAAAVSRYVGDP